MNEKTNLLSLVSKDIPFDTVALGRTVRQLRERLDLTQSQLGDLASLSAAEISKLENGSRKKIPLDTLIKICPHLNVPIDYLLASCSSDCITDHEHFYNYDGKEVDLYNIARNLYSVDSELLLLISTVDFLADKDFIKFIKLWIKVKNKLSTYNTCETSNPFLCLFESLKSYCSSFFQTILEPLT